jgi:hypothetical protein
MVFGAALSRALSRVEVKVGRMTDSLTPLESSLRAAGLAPCHPALGWRDRKSACQRLRNGSRPMEPQRRFMERGELR